MRREVSSPKLKFQRSTDLKLKKSPSKTSLDRRSKDGGGKLQPINRPKMLKKLSERYEKGEAVIIDLVHGIMHEISPVFEV